VEVARITGLRYNLRLVSGVPVITAPAELDIGTAEELRATLATAAMRRHTAVVVDLTDTRFCDSAGLAVLVRSHRRALAEGSELRLVIPPASAVSQVLIMAGVERVVPHFATLEDALATAVQRSRPDVRVGSAAVQLAGTREHGPGADTRVCEQCGTVFVPQREHARFCRVACRAAWNREHLGDPAVEASALQWSITAMCETNERLAEVNAPDRPRALAAISEAVWWITMVDATLVRRHPVIYQTVLADHGGLEGDRIEKTLAGLRFVRNQTSGDTGLEYLINPECPAASNGRVMSWTWKPAIAPAIGTLSARGHAWEMARYRDYQGQLAGRTVGETFQKAVTFLTLTSANVAATKQISADKQVRNHYNQAAVEPRMGGSEVPTAPGPAGLQDRLRDIQAITDAALSQLGDHELLAELLERTKAILEADTAAVLLLDGSSGQLIATAAAGLEEEVRQGVRIPVGKGFAGRIAASRQPVILDHVDHTTVLNPILWAKGIRALMGVPLIASGRIIGVLHVGSLTERTFTTDDVELLQLAADRAATAVQSLMMRDDRAAAVALQRSLIPAALPVSGEAEMAARYVPGEGSVGGDWYDVFTLASGQLGVVIGDVAGSGMAAAVVMGRMRSALRAYALLSPDPAEVLAQLDAKMQHFETGALATVLYAVFDPALDRVHVCSAGHFPPVIASPGRPSELAGVQPGLLIGAAPNKQRAVATLDINPGTLLCFYTDGLIERRDQLIDDSLARLCEVVTAEPPETACAKVMSAFVGSQPVHDDIALLMFRRH